MEQRQIIILLLVLAAAALLFLLFRAWKKRQDKDVYVIKEEDKLHITMENKDLRAVAEILLAGLGGRENITSVEADGTRLKAAILEYGKVDEKKLREAKAGGILRPSKTAVHIIIGPMAEEVAAELRKELS